MDGKKYTKLDEDKGISKKSTIFYNNLMGDNDDDNENNAISVPSILEDQLLKLQKRNHYLKNTYVLIDSKNRDITERTISQYINYEKIAILFNNNQPGKLFFTLYNTTLVNDDIIMFENINILNNQLDTLNGVNINILQYDKILNTPLFTLTSYTNKDLLNIFEWYTIYPVIKDIYSDIKLFSSSTDVIFYSLSFASGDYVVDDYTYIDSTRSFTIKRINSIIPGYATSTYYKIPLSYKIFNIYKIKLVDIKLPNIIFNINNTILDAGKFSYGVNAYFKMIYKSNKFKVSSIDYICQSVNYNYFNRKALYNNLDTYYGSYTAASNQDIPKYTGTSIITVIDDLIKNCDNLSLKSLIDKYGFQVAYYFLYKYTNHDNIYSTYAYAYYVITLDFFQSMDDKLIKRVNVLNNKMPIIYYNNTIIYVNNDTYTLGLYNVTYHDLIKMKQNLEKYKNTELLLTNLLPNPTIGNISSAPFGNSKDMNFNWTYTIAIKPINQNFNAPDLINNELYALGQTGEVVVNSIYEYIGVDSVTQFYNYKVLFPHNYAQGSWILGNTLYLNDGTDTKIATIETISYELLIDTNVADVKTYDKGELIRITKTIAGINIDNNTDNNTEINTSSINFRILDKGRYDTNLKYIIIVPVILNKTDNPGCISSEFNYRTNRTHQKPDTELGSGIIVWNNINTLDASSIYISTYNDAGNVEAILGYLKKGDTLIIEDKNNSENLENRQEWNILNTEVIQDLKYVEYTVELKSGNYDFNKLPTNYPILVTYSLNNTLNNTLIRKPFDNLAEDIRYYTLYDTNDINIGNLYYIGYYPIAYTIVFEKSNDFDNMAYLQKKDIVLKIIFVETIFTYSYINLPPIKTSKHNLETYNIYPVYDIMLPNGYYNEVELSKTIENELNNTNIKIYDHLKKDFIYPDKTKYSLNQNDFAHPVFKNMYNPSNREFSISAYQKNNRTRYKSFYNLINPYLFIETSNCVIQNNERIYFEVNEIYDTKLSEFASKHFNREITTRILPTYTYALRLISPLPDNFVNDDMKYNKIYETLDNLLEQIKMNPYEMKNSFTNLNTKLKNIGIALINKYNNSNILQTDGTILEKKGIPCLLNKFELCLCITNIHFTMESYKFGRVCKILDKTSNQQGNFNVTFQMSGDTSQSFPFYIGDIIYSLESKQFYCVVPNEWGIYMDIPEIAQIHNSLPTNDIIRGGYINYLCLLYKYTNNLYLFQVINDFNLHKYNQFKKKKRGHPWKIWFIQEEYNANYGFEIYFDYNKDIKFDNTQINLSFLRCEDFSLFFEDNKSPKDIMGIDAKKVNKLEDFQNNTNNIPFYHTLSNLMEVNVRNITEFYLTYGSDSKLKNKLYLKLDNIKGFNKGDTVFLKNLAVEPIFQRNIFNIRETVNHSMNKFINFEMYLNILIYRLSFITLGVPIPNAANDISALDNTIRSEQSIYAVDFIANEINILSGTTSYENFIKINNIDKLINEICKDDKNMLVNSLNITSSEIISTTVTDIRTKLLYKKILPWFLIGDNLLNFTHGSQYEYFSILSKYVNIADNIYRLELKVDDDLFIFVKNLDIYDEDNSKIGYILDTSLYSDYIPVKGLIYHLYIALDKDYTKVNNLVKGVKINTKKYGIENTIRHYNILNFNHEKVDNTNNWLYFYDTYLRFKVIVTANPNQNINQNNTLDFNIPSSITSTYNNLFNTDNVELDIFKNGYYVYIGNSENFEDADLFNETYRTCITMLDNKNIIKACDDLGILPDITKIQSITADMINSEIDTSTKEYKLKHFGLTADMKIAMKKYIDIIQMMNDFPVQHTFMINMDWSNRLEAGTLDAFKYYIRRMNSIFQILGNSNFILDKFSYDKFFIYGKKEKTGTIILDYSNVNLFYSYLFSNLVSNKEIITAYQNNTISSELCSWVLYTTRFKEITNDLNADFGEQLILFDQINILYGFVLYGTNIDAQTGLNTKTIWVIFPSYVFEQNLLNSNANLSNFLITFNFIFVDQNKQWNVDTIEYNQNIDNNIILSAFPETASTDGSNYRIFKINLKFTPKYPIKRGLPICIKDYYTTVYKKDIFNANIKNTNIIYLHKNWTNQIMLKKDCVLHINMGSNNSLYKKYISKQVDFSNTLNSYQTDNFTNEEINIINKTEELNLENGKSIFKCTLQNPIRFEFANDIPVIIRYAPVFFVNGDNIDTYCQNSINVSLLTTIPVLINNEWYTRIYYSSSTNIDIYNVSKNGISAFQNNSCKSINISGMKGYLQPNIGFQKEERTYIFNSSSKEDEQNNKYIKPVPNGVYNIEYFQKEDGLNFMQDGINNFNISGYYKSVYNMNSPEQEDEWIDNYINNISLQMICDKDLSDTSAYDFSNGINLYDQSSMILLCKLIGVTKLETNDTSNNDIIYKFQFDFELNTNYNNFANGFNQINFTDLQNSFTATIFGGEFPDTLTLTNTSIDYTTVSEFTKYTNNYITIKGKYLGYGGILSIVNNNDILNQIPYQISHVNPDTNNIELDLEFSDNLYSFYYRNNNFMNFENYTNDFINTINYNHKAINSEHINPIFANFQESGYLEELDQTDPTFLTLDYTNYVTSNYCIYPLKYGVLSSTGTIFKKNIYKPFSADVLDYIFLCINNIDSTFIVEQQNTINNKIILAKIYINKALNNIDLQVRHYELVFDIKLLPSLEELEIIYMDKNGNLVNFNNIDSNFTLEVSQYLERVKNINTKNGMVF